MTDRINGLPDEELANELWQCCPSERWINEVIGGRPYRDAAAVLHAAERALGELSLDEWATAVNAAGDWPIPACDDGTRAAATVALGLYREQFGHRFVTAHENLTADQLLMRIRIRLGHEDAAELRKSRAEHAIVVCRRVGRLLQPAQP
jgi:2-oxo-4-hydroxy-4-carboxy-5-ureidoimidazoline decarboxylase